MTTATTVNAAPEWDWPAFVGTGTALKYVRRDLPKLDRMLTYVTGRTVCVQAGGNLGIFPKRLAQSFKTIYTFEPDPQNFAAMCVNAPELNIVKLQAAIGSKRGLVGISGIRRDGKTNNHEGIKHVSGDGVVPTFLIDDLALPVCDFLCLDCEGYDLFALSGATETISRCEPVIAVEVNKNLPFVGLTPDDVYRFMHLIGYQHAETLGSDQVFVPRSL